VRKSIQKLLLVCAIVASGTAGLKAAPVLDGVSFFLAQSNGSHAGQFWGYQGVAVWVEQNGTWLPDFFGLLNVPLVEGDNHFQYYVSGNGIVSAFVGMNFQIGYAGSPCRDGISILAGTGTDNFSANAGNDTFWPHSTRCGSPTFQPGKNTTIWTDGVDTVELTHFSYTDHLSSGVNRVSYGGPNPAGSPDFWPDHFGSFTLRLNDPAGGPDPNAIPEPSMVLAVGIGLAAFGWRRRSYK